MIELGGNITLTGFQERDYAELIVIKKIVGRYARQISDYQPGFERLLITLKPVQRTNSGNKFEIEAHCVLKGEQHAANATEQNLFVALDGALKQLCTQCEKG